MNPRVRVPVPADVRKRVGNMLARSSLRAVAEDLQVSRFTIDDALAAGSTMRPSTLRTLIAALDRWDSELANVLEESE